MKYAFIDNDRFVREVIPEFNPSLPGVPIGKRYTKDFLDRCLEIPEDLDVQPGMEYLPLQNIFKWPLKYTGITDIVAGTSFYLTFNQDGEFIDMPNYITQNENGSYTVDKDFDGIVELTYRDKYDRITVFNIEVHKEDNEGAVEE